MTSAGNEDASAAPVARIGARKPPEPARSQAERRKGPHPVRIKDLCLELFEARPGQSLHYREIARLVGKNAGSVSAILSTHIEFKSLGEGVWELDTDGNQKGAKPPRPVSHQYTKQKEISLSSGPRGVLLILVQQGSRSRERIHGGSLRSLVDAGLAKNERGVVKATQLGRQFIERAEHKQGRYRLQLETREAPAKSTKEPVPVPSDELLPVTPAEVPAL